MKIAVIGLGYVGLPLSFQFARSGVTVLGVDIDTSKVDALNAGRSYIKHIPSEAVAEATRSGSFSATSDFSRVAEVRCRGKRARPRRLGHSFRWNMFDVAAPGIQRVHLAGVDIHA